MEGRGEENIGSEVEPANLCTQRVAHRFVNFAAAVEKLAHENLTMRWASEQQWRQNWLDDETVWCCCKLSPPPSSSSSICLFVFSSNLKIRVVILRQVVKMANRARRCKLQEIAHSLACDALAQVNQLPVISFLVAPLLPLSGAWWHRRGDDDAITCQITC